MNKLYFLAIFALLGSQASFAMEKDSNEALFCVEEGEGKDMPDSFSFLRGESDFYSPIELQYIQKLQAEMNKRKTAKKTASKRNIAKNAPLLARSLNFEEPQEEPSQGEVIEISQIARRRLATINDDFEQEFGLKRSIDQN